MKKISLFFLLILQNSHVLYSRGVADTAMIEKTGWLVYWHDNIIWVAAELNKNTKNIHFFQKRREYRNGVSMIGNINATVYKSIAKGYSISYYNNDSIVSETDPNFLDSIWILPVKVKFKTGFESALEDMTLFFKKNKQEIFIKFKAIADYRIREIALLRKCDMRKIKQIKNY